uniref:Uncharacterized protein n=1 Tax=Onchocerca volvulus TaxID=6282 RepID=A0A8R1Y0S0_ONCVO
MNVRKFIRRQNSGEAFDLLVSDDENNTILMVEIDVHTGKEPEKAFWKEFCSRRISSSKTNVVIQSAQRLKTSRTFLSSFALPNLTASLRTSAILRKLQKEPTTR